MSSRPNLTELPEWVKSLGLPKVAVEAIDRYWKPVWDEVKHELDLLPDHRARPSQAPPAPDGDWLAFEAIEELEPGDRWRESFREMWPAYRGWYLKEGESARPDLETCRRELGRHMPELMPTYERLVELAAERRTIVLYEAPHRVVRTLADLADAKLGAQVIFGWCCELNSASRTSRAAAISASVRCSLALRPSTSKPRASSLA